MSFLTEVLNATHNKKAFVCGKSMLDNYLHKQAGQDVKRKLAVCFVANDVSANLIKGYYTLSNNSISLDLVPDNLRNKLPSAYSAIPTTLLGHLAVDDRYKGFGLGKLLLIDALKRSYEVSLEIGSLAVIVEPLDQEAQRFYEKYGFVLLPDSGRMFLPINQIKQLF